MAEIETINLFLCAQIRPLRTVVNFLTRRLRPI